MTLAMKPLPSHTIQIGKTIRQFWHGSYESNDTNVCLRPFENGFAYTCRAVLPYFLQHGGGAIVNTSSTAGIKGSCHVN
jgi:NAD(P)-dependent dehydrogenase (short-subunit alcohol dehydrogenase family)